MSIPFFYEPVQFKGAHQKGKHVTSFMVDGGMLSNFPVDVFDRTDGGRRGGRPSASSSPPSRGRADVGRSSTIKGTFDLARAMVGTMTSFHDQMHIDDPSPCSLARCSSTPAA